MKKYLPCLACVLWVAGCDTPPSTAYLRDPLLQPAPVATMAVTPPPPVNPPSAPAPASAPVAKVFMDPLPTPPHPTQPTLRLTAAELAPANSAEMNQVTNQPPRPREHRPRNQNARRIRR